MRLTLLHLQKSDDMIPQWKSKLKHDQQCYQDLYSSSYKQLENHIKGPNMLDICKKLEIYAGRCTSSEKELPSTQKKFLKQSHNEPFVLRCYCYTNHSLLSLLEFQNICNANDKIKECSWWVTNSNIKHYKMFQDKRW